MPGRSGPPTTGHSGRELPVMGALVLLLGFAFVTLLVEPTQASVSVAERIAPSAGSDLLDPGSAAAGSPPEAAAESPAPVPLEDMRVRVERLGIDLPLLPGDTDRDAVLQATPTGAAFLLPASAIPGSGGNSYIYAHARAGMFLSLWGVSLGDVVEVTMAFGEVRRYLVTEIHPRVAPTDFSYTLPTRDERITLQTSTGPRATDPRFVVVAARSD